jgi:RNA polymerase sigma factor (sigma-70 family)
MKTEEREVGGLEFDEFFRSQYGGLVRALYLLTASQGEAEELAQETMARLYGRWEQIRSMDSPAGYAYRVAVNLNRQRLRRLRIRTRSFFSATVGHDSQQSPEVRTEITEAIESLSRRQREAFLLVEWWGLSAEEAGRILKIAPVSVRARVHRARIALKDWLDEDGVNHG